MLFRLEKPHLLSKPMIFRSSPEAFNSDELDHHGSDSAEELSACCRGFTIVERRFRVRDLS